MKLLAFALLLVVVVAVSADTIEERWTKFKAEFNRNYSGAEEAERFELFKNKVKQIDEHNAKYEKGEVTWTQAINDFTDKKKHELPGHFGGIPIPAH